MHPLAPPHSTLHCGHDALAGLDRESHMAQCHTNVPREPHLSQVNRAEAWASLTCPTGHFFIRPLDKSAGENILRM